MVGLYFDDGVGGLGNFDDGVGWDCILTMAVGDGIVFDNWLL